MKSRGQESNLHLHSARYAVFTLAVKQALRPGASSHLTLPLAIISIT